MIRKFAYAAAAVAATLSLAAAQPVDAQSRRAEGGQRVQGRSEQSGGGARETRGRQAVPRASERRQSSAAEAARPSESRQYRVPQPGDRSETARSDSGAQAMPRGSESRRSQAPQPGSRGDTARSYSSGVRAAPKGPAYSHEGQRAVPRPSPGYGSPAYRNDDRRGYAPYGGAYRRDESHVYVRPRYVPPYRPYYFSRPYYGFRAHLHLGFGLWLGVAVPYPWTYFGTYVPRVYGYYGQGYYGAAPGVQQYGGLSFDMQPADADVFIDGEYVGTVGTFTPYGEPLTLWPGIHRVAIVRDGFRTMEFDVKVLPGQVIPYRGMLARW